MEHGVRDHHGQPRIKQVVETLGRGERNQRRRIGDDDPDTPKQEIDLIEARLRRVKEMLK
jgi:hypothetical protein